MEQEKIGLFLKELRKEKGLTQEQLAERFQVSDRTVSRWENGRNMPDLSLLVEMADFYDVDIRELIDGERKSGKMNQEEKETLLKVADYTENERNLLMHRVCIVSVVGFIGLIAALIFESRGLGSRSDFLMTIESMCFGVAAGALLTSILFATGVLGKIRSNCKTRRIARILKIVCPIILLVCILITMFL
ncbi:MAG: helix-turn-helix transcriptional regulator [bacterium]|nr:helix-turn-helix transcriptional regulator [bacterium]